MNPKSPNAVKNEMVAKIARIRRRLAEIKEYKKLIARDGIEPDSDDKRVESELIVRLLYLEKQLAGPKPGLPQERDESGEQESRPAKGRGRARPKTRGDQKPKAPPHPALKTSAKPRPETSGPKRPGAAKAGPTRTGPVKSGSRPKGKSRSRPKGKSAPGGKR